MNTSERIPPGKKTLEFQFQYRSNGFFSDAEYMLAHERQCQPRVAVKIARKSSKKIFRKSKEQLKHKRNDFDH